VSRHAAARRPRRAARAGARPALLVTGGAAVVAGVVLALAPPPGVAPVGTLATAPPVSGPAVPGAAVPGDAGDPTGAAAITAGPGTPGGAGPAGAPPAAVPPASRLLAPPRVLRLPGVGVVAEIDPAGVRADGGLAVPDDPRRVGWWIGSALPGGPTGRVLLAGHVDHVRHGLGAMYRLWSLPVGAPVEVETADRRYHYRVVARRSYPRTELPADLFDRATRPGLALVTCGGAFTPGYGYTHNVVVYAEPVGPP
jgi:hypothetical protein